jgi:DNA (cytosine-5)-methyltransferase 1
MKNEFTLGSLFAGIGGFDLGFERAGWTTSWQVEIDPNNRAVLAARFPGARQFEDIREVWAHELGKVRCITAGFPCQDISQMGGQRRGPRARKKNRPGLEGRRSGLFFEAMRIIEELHPDWIVLENVMGLFTSNGGKDFETIITELAARGYMGCVRVLNARFFGIPQNRRRIFVVAGLGKMPSPEFMDDAAAVVPISVALTEVEESRAADKHAGYCFTAKNAAGRINLGCEVLIAEANGWNQMAKRQRSSELHGVPIGLDRINLYQSWAAGNAVSPQVAQWIAEKLKRS